MLEIEKLSKDAVYDVMRELLFSFNYMWFQFEELIKSNCSGGFEAEGFRKIYHDFGSYEAKRLSKTLAISGGGIDSLIELIKHSHWAVFENIEVTKLTENSFRMRTIDCSAQSAAKRWGMEYYECEVEGYLIRNGFFKQLNHNAEIQRIFTPPEPGPESAPEKASCEWLISIED